MKIAFLGDIYLDKAYLECKGDLLLDIKSELDKCDFVVANLESPVTAGTDRLRKIGPNLKMSHLPNEILDSIDIFSLANNHMMDFSSSGLTDTIKYLESKGKRYFGAGVDLNTAFKETVISKNNVTVALIGMAEDEFSLTFGNYPGVAPLNPIYSYNRIASAVTKYDHVIIFIHGGNEFSSLPSPKYRQLCKMYVDMGVSSVISSHTHIVGPIEEYKSKPIFYSLGNCLFNSKKPPKGWLEGLVVNLELSKKAINYTYFGFKQAVSIGGTMKLSNSDHCSFYVDLTAMSASINDKDIYLKLWDDFLVENSEKYLFRVCSPVFFKGAYTVFSRLKINKLLYTSQSKLLKQNYISCESHREVVLDSFSKEEK
ncbi:CapA family protein [Shewanella sp. AC34-MNA-CIBAN-0136]|uniref:CapA family protein n=1 Tax=Shewanella sp. AC34-MNA-CIBAN-0136 TaxID=3140463 RepID=UPI00332B3B10